MNKPWTPSQAQELTESMDRLTEMFGASISELLHGCLNSVQETAPGLPDPVTMAAIVNGALNGLLHFMADMSSQGRMPDPNGHLTSVLRMAAETWEGIRTSSVDGGATLQ